MNQTIKQEDTKYIVNTYARYPLYVTSAKGCILKDDHNKEYLDFTSGIGVTNLGHCFAPWIKATSKQLQNLEHISNLFYTKPAIDLAKKLCLKANMKQVFFANSGAEANEGAIKIARKYANDHYQGIKNEIITLRNSFHGRTLATLSATGQDELHQNFQPFVDGFQYVEANNIEDLKTKVSSKTLAIMIEVVQGEGGVNLLTKNFLHTIQEICDTQDILFIIDEIQTGIGRCGCLFTYMLFDLHPDIVTCAKGLGNGLPIAAILLSNKCKDTLSYGDHGTTFGGNPIACAGANVVLDYMNDDLYTHVNQMSNQLQKRLSSMKYVENVTGLGFMLGIEINSMINPKDVVIKCIDQGLVILTAKNKLRLLPPLNIKVEEITKGLDILEKVLIQLGGKQ